MADLGDYLEQFLHLRVNRGGGTPSPHKMCLLLAVIDLYDADPDRPNRIEYEPLLLERFREFFHAVKGPDDRERPWYPFFHLKSAGFWHLHPVPGRGEALQALTTVNSPRQLLDNVEIATLDDDLHGLLREQEARLEFNEAIVRHWFDRSADELRRIMEKSHRINRYEQQIRQLDVPAVAELPPEYIRDPAFRRVVLQAYDYRCAATGTRIILPDESVMVQAAHIEPHAVAGNDDPRNGMALTPDMHWAMDRNIIAPGPDYKWHVSKQLDRRVRDNEPLWRLEGMEIMLPKENRFWPSETFLGSRFKHLL